MSALSQLISSIKSVDDNLGTGIAKNLLIKLSESMSFAVGDLQKQISSVVGTMKPDFKREVIELITKFNTGDNDEKMAAFDKIKKLQEKFNLDLINFSKIFGFNIDKLNKTVEAFNQIEEQRRQTALEEQQLFREKMIPTKTVGGNVMPLTKREQLTEIYDIQKQIYDLEKERKSLLRQFEKNEIDNETFKAEIKNIADREKALSERKAGVMYDDPNRPKTLREQFVGAAQGTGEFLRGERGPELVRGSMSAMYNTVKAPIDASRQMLQTVDMLTLGLTGAISKSLVNFLAPSFKLFTNTMKTGFTSLGTIFIDRFKFFGRLILRGLLFLGAALGLGNFGKIGTTLLSLLGLSGLAKAMMGGGTALATGGAIAGTTAGAAAAGTAAGTAAAGASTGSKFAKAARFGLGRAGPIGLGLTAAYASGELAENAETTTGKAVGVGSSALSGGATGALIGSIIPGLGTVVGGVIGTALGGLYGLVKAYDSPEENAEKGIILGMDQSKFDTLGDKKVPKSSDLMKMSQEFVNENYNKNISPVVNNVAPTNISSNTVQNINQNVDVINKEPTINLINSQGYGYTVV